MNLPLCFWKLVLAGGGRRRGGGGGGEDYADEAAGLDDIASLDAVYYQVQTPLPPAPPLPHNTLSLRVPPASLSLSLSLTLLACGPR